MDVFTEAAWITLLALDRIDTAWSDRGLIVGAKQRGKTMLTARHAQKIDLLAWKYRRHLPRHLAPKLPPRDPIVRDMKDQAAHV